MRVNGAGEMEALGEALGRVVEPGDVLALAGDLGAGKTVLVKGVARGLDVPAGVAVTSPTFTIVHSYRGGRVPLHHVDLYRIERAAELEHLGLDELYRDDAVVAVEWFDRFPGHAPADHLAITIAHAGEDAREVALTPRGPRAARLVAALPAELRA